MARAAGGGTGAGSPTETLTYEQVEVGEDLAPLVLPITRTLIVSAALASRDYQDVHHDPVMARERGSKDIFMNILTTNGLVGRYVTDWSGPGAVLGTIVDPPRRAQLPRRHDDAHGVGLRQAGLEADGSRARWRSPSRGRTGWATT